MYAGRVVEQGTLDELFYDPTTPTPGACSDRSRASTATALAILPAIGGLPPSMMNPPAGCHFRPRCPHAFAKCIESPTWSRTSRTRRRTWTAAG